MKFDDSLEEIRKGFIGEGIVRDYLAKSKYDFMQIDIVCEKDGNYFICEVKTQEKFTKRLPDYPFDGHGLPPYQMKKRLEFAKRIDARAVLFVYDIEDEIVYWQYLDVLNDLPDDKKRLTKTEKRIIFDISTFNILPK